MMFYSGDWSRKGYRLMKISALKAAVRLHYISTVVYNYEVRSIVNKYNLYIFISFRVFQSL